MRASILSATSLLVGAAVAQPHLPHHAKHHRRDNTVVWVTNWVSVTEIVPLTTTIWVSSGYVAPVKSTSATTSSFSQVPAQFFQGAAKPATSSASIAALPATQAPPPPSDPVAPPPPPAVIPPVQSSSSSSSVSVPPPAPPPAPVPVAVAPVAVVPLAAPAPPAPAPASPPASSQSSTGECSPGSPCEGEITYYEAGLGACGFVNNGDLENVVALPHGLMGTKSNGNPYCGRTITVTCTATGKTTTATVVDKCMGCVGYTIDLSNKAFLELDDLAVGRTGATWYFN